MILELQIFLFSAERAFEGKEALTSLDQVRIMIGLLKQKGLIDQEMQLNQFLNNFTTSPSVRNSIALMRSARTPFDSSLALALITNLYLLHLQFNNN